MTIPLAFCTVDSAGVGDWHSTFFSARPGRSPTAARGFPLHGSVAFEMIHVRSSRRILWIFQEHHIRLNDGAGRHRDPFGCRTAPWCGSTVDLDGQVPSYTCGICAARSCLSRTMQDASRCTSESHHQTVFAGQQSYPFRRTIPLLSDHVDTGAGAYVNH